MSTKKIYKRKNSAQETNSRSLTFSGLLLMLIAVTLVISPSLYNTFVLPKFALLIVGTTICLLVFVVEYRNDRFVWSPLDIPVLLFMVFTILSSTVALHKPSAVFGGYERYEGMITTLSFGAIYFLMSRTIPRVKNGHNLFMMTIVGIGTALSFYALLQYFGLDPLSWSAEGFESERSFATIGNPVTLGSFLAATMPIAVYMLLNGRDHTARSLILMTVICCIIGFGLLATASRGAWIAAFGGIAIILVSLARSGQLNIKKLFPSAFAFLGASAIFVLMSGTRTGTTNLIERARNLIDVTSGSGAERLEIWRISMRMISDRPIFGFGLDNFRYAFTDYKTTTYAKLGGYEAIADNAHNLLLNLAVTQGIISALCFLAIIVLVTVMVFTHGRRMPKDVRPQHIAIAAGIVSFSVSMLVGISSIPGMLLFWMAIGAMASLSIRESPYSVKPTLVKRLFVGPAIALTIMALYVGTSLYLADSAFSQAIRASEEGDFQTAAQLYERSIQLNRYNGFYPSVAAESYMDWSQVTKEKQLLDYAIDRLILARTINPYEIDNTSLLVSAYLDGAKYFDREYIDRAREETGYLAGLEGNSPMYHYYAAELAVLDGKRDVAVKHVNKALQIDPTFEPAKAMQRALLKYQ